MKSDRDKVRTNVKRQRGSKWRRQQQSQASILRWVNRLAASQTHFNPATWKYWLDCLCMSRRVCGEECKEPCVCFLLSFFSTGNRLISSEQMLKLLLWLKERNKEINKMVLLGRWVCTSTSACAVPHFTSWLIQRAPPPLLSGMNVKCRVPASKSAAIKLCFQRFQKLLAVYARRKSSHWFLHRNHCLTKKGRRERKVLIIRCKWAVLRIPPSHCTLSCSSLSR